MCHLMKRYTLVTIIRLDTGASGMYRIPASGGKHLGNMVLPPPASLSHFSSLPSLFLSPVVYLSIQQNSTGGLLDLHCLIAHLTCAHIFDVQLHNRRTCEGQFRVSGLFSSRLLPPLCQTPDRGVKTTMNSGIFHK